MVEDEGPARGGPGPAYGGPRPACGGPRPACGGPPEADAWVSLVGELLCPPSHERPHFVAEAQPDQPLPVAQLPDEAAPPCQNGLVLVRPPCPRFIARWVEDRYQAILARWRNFVWQLRHRQWLLWLRFCYEQRPRMARWGHMEERRRRREERRQ